ncbi:MAG: hypothetical protein M1546_14885, partial [Chloroflexi bacterium]|nr:hypothetical protein [Chloroflexota bacterium]
MLRQGFLAIINVSEAVPRDIRKSLGLVRCPSPYKLSARLGVGSHDSNAQRPVSGRGRGGWTGRQAW